MLIQIAEKSIFNRSKTLSLNGSGSYVTIPSAADLQNPDEITVEAWIYPTDIVTPNQWFIAKSDGYRSTRFMDFSSVFSWHDKLGRDRCHNATIRLDSRGCKYRTEPRPGCIIAHPTFAKELFH